VDFSDGTTGAYVAEELLELRPQRERTPVPAERVGTSRASSMAQKEISGSKTEPPVGEQ
jgi:hypothetical protein